ncbi:MAG: hypothetical protein MRZ74_13455 [Blautia sp.]|nr:hypothetical protein [Blautia sp.]MDY5032324.1 MBG domain-containing protein [Blautia sp.]
MASDYTISESIGTLTVTENTDEIVVTTTGGTFTYDGEAHGATVSVSTLPKGYTLETAVSNDKATHVAEGTVTANCDMLVIKNAKGVDVTSRLNIRYVDGSITITPATLTVTTPDASKVYDGDPLTAAGSISGFAKEETAAFATTGSQTEVGNSKNTYSINWDGSAAESDYTVSATVGTLTVTEYAGEITVTTTGGTFTYDGEAHGATVSVSTLPKGYTLETATSDDTATHVADGTVEANCDTLVIRNAAGEDVTSKLNIKYVDGSITITPATLTVETQSASKVYDKKALTAGGTITGFIKDETASFAVIGSQLYVGSSKNKYTLTWNETAKESDYTIAESIGTLSVIDGEIDPWVDPSLVITKTAEDKNYELNEEVTFTINVTNIYAKAQTITVSEQAGVTLADAKDGVVVFENVAPGETKTATATYKITEADIVAGSFTNTAKAAFSIEGTVREYSATKTVNTVAMAADFSVTKAVVGETGGYKADDTVTFNITVENEGNVTLKNVTVAEALAGAAFITGYNSIVNGNAVISSLPVGQSATIKVEYKVTQADVDNGGNTNSVSVTAVDPKEQSVGPKTADASFTTETKAPSITVTKALTRALKDTKFAVGDRPLFEITVKNSGNVTLHGVTVTEALTGAVIETGSGYEVTNGAAVLTEDLAPGKEVVVNATYVVTQDDVDEGSFTNTVNAAAKDPDDGDVTDDDSLDVSTVDKVQTVTAVKNLIAEEAGKKFAAGETAHFEITVTNVGNVTLKGITVTEKLNGAVITDGTGYTHDGTAATIASLGVGASITVNAQYTVTQADVDNGGTINIVGVDIPGDNDPADPTVPVPTIDKTAEIGLSKTVTNAPASGFAVGETAEFDVVVTNNGNVTLHNVIVEEIPVRGTIAAGTGYVINSDGKAVIETMAPGATVTVKATYNLTQDDIDAVGDVKNTVKASGEGPESGPDPADATADEVIPRVSKNISFTADKELKNEGTGTDKKFRVNDIAEFDITVTNNGNVTLTNVQVSEMAGAEIAVPTDAKYTASGNVATIAKLEVGQSVVVKATYKVTQADVDNGIATNVATVTAEGPGGNPDPVTVTEDVPTEAKAPAFDVTKVITNLDGALGTRGSGKAFNAGQTVEFQITVTNTGNVTLKNVAVTDILNGITVFNGNGFTVSGNVATIPTIEVGEEVVITASYVVTQADVDADGTKNVVTVTGEGPNPTDGKPADKRAEVSVPTADRNPDLRAVKTVTNSGSGKDGKFKAGETAEFAIVVTNSGNVTLTDVTVAEGLSGAEITTYEGAPYTVNNNRAVAAELGVGKSVTVTATYTVKQSDIDNGRVSNIATVTGTAPGNKQPDPVNPTVSIGLDDQNPALSAVKIITNEGSGTEGSFKVNETVNFRITVRNVGNVTLTDVTVAEGLDGAEIISDSAYDLEDGKAVLSKLGVGESADITATYVITQDDVDAGGTKNIVTASASAPGDDPEDATAEVDVPTDEQAPAAVTGKTVTNAPTGGFKAGETAEFAITVQNTGNVTLKNVTVAEALTNASITEDDGYTINEYGEAVISQINVGETATVYAQYTVTQDDIDAGTLTNIAAVKIPDQPDPQQPEAEVPLEEKAPELSAVKKLTSEGSGVNGKFKVDDIAYFEITVENTGNVTLTNVTVTEQLENAVIRLGNGYERSEDYRTATIGTMKVGDKITVLAAYKVTQADVDAAQLENIAVAAGKGPGKDPASKTVKAAVPTDVQSPDITAVKTLTNLNEATGTKLADGVETKAFKAGEKAKFDIVVSNTGNVTLKNVTVEETLTGAAIISGDGYDVNEEGKAVISELAVGASVTVKAEYVVTQADVDNGGAVNTVTVGGEGPGETDPDPEEPEEPIPTEDKDPSFTAVKTLTNLDDALGTRNGEKAFQKGQTAEFDITVTNDGNVTLTNITVTEKLAGAKIVYGEGYTVIDGEAVISKLEVGNKVVVKAEYEITQADVDNGGTTNAAAVEGKGPGEDPDPEEPEEPIPTEEEKPDLTAVKTLTNLNEAAGTRNGEKAFQKGQTAKFDITVTNSGNVTLTNVRVTEKLAGAKIVAGDGYTVSADGKTATVARMEVGDIVIVKTEYVVTQADVDNGGTANVVTVEGEGPGEKDPDPEEPEEPIPTEDKKPAFDAEKDLINTGTGKDGSFKVGETANFQITVTNTGNVTLKNVVVTEKLTGATILAGNGYSVNEDQTEATFTEIPVNGTVIVNATYQVTQDDVDAGGTKNIATVEGEGPEPTDPKPEPKEVEEPIPTDEQKPDAITAKVVTNTGSGANGSFQAGETATFDIRVQNAGNVTLKNVTVGEALEGAVIVEGEGYTVEDGKAVIASMAVGSDPVIVKAEYTVTQDDVDNADNSGLKNIATVKIPGKDDPQQPEVPIPTDDPNPAFEAEKTLTNLDEATGIKVADGVETKAFKAGETAKFDITVTNTGNVTLTDIRVTEKLAGAKIVEGDGYTVSDGTAVIDKLEVKSAVTVQAEYTVTQDDVDNGEIANAVTVTGDSPNPTDPDPEPKEPEEPIPTEDKDPKFETSKVLTNEGTGEDGKFKVDEIAEFDITVKNAGNVTLKNVAVTEMEGAVITEGEGYSINENGEAVIAELPVGEAVVVKAAYTVTQADVDNGGTTNVVTVKGEGPGEDPDPETPEEPIPTEDISPALAVDKAVTNKAHAENGKYEQGETIEYTVTVTNTGNASVTDISIEDSLAEQLTLISGAEVTAEGTFAIGDLAPGASQAVVYEYVVNAEDIEAGIVINAAVASGTAKNPAEPENPFMLSEEDGTETPVENPAINHVTVTKELTDEYGRGTSLAEPESFEIALYKDATLTEEVGRATMEFNALEGYKSVTFDNLVPGTYYVAELENGSPITELVAREETGVQFMPSYLVDGVQEVVVEKGAMDEEVTAEFTFNNLIFKSGYSHVRKNVTVTKEVYNKDGSKKNTSETFLIGIFGEDGKLDTTHVDKNIIAIPMNGSWTGTETFHVSILENENVTLYVREIVDSNGTLAEDSEKFEYDPEVVNSDLTFDLHCDENQTVIVKNTATKDPEPTKAPTAAPTKTPGYSGGSGSSATDKTTSSKVNAVKTGDNSMIEFYLILFAAAAAAIVIFVFVRRRKSNADKDKK